MHQHTYTQFFGDKKTKKITENVRNCIANGWHWVEHQWRMHSCPKHDQQQISRVHLSWRRAHISCYPIGCHESSLFNEARWVSFTDHVRVHTDTHTRIHTQTLVTSHLPVQSFSNWDNRIFCATKTSIQSEIHLNKHQIFHREMSLKTSQNQWS